ncbi:MAG: MarR family transcriptional regulator [Butyricicoccus sp.]|nr:MarR family transcriptional regulator [Butyricicoccus sp.]
MEAKRKALLSDIWAAEDQAYVLMSTYDSMPHQYGPGMFLYQAEGYIIMTIAQHPDITVTELASILHKTPSACSQMVRKLCEKELVEQIRNPENKRQYNLRLTPDGQKVVDDHAAFNRECQMRTFEMLREFSAEELACFLRVRECINDAYQADVNDAQNALSEEK